MQTTHSHLWGIILAGGDGRRMQPFIRAHFGCDRPKQYCTFLGTQSMLRQTIRRAERLVPPERLLTVVTRPRLPYAQAELDDRPPGTFIVQPCNRDTGPGICSRCSMCSTGIQRPSWRFSRRTILCWGRSGLWRRWRPPPRS